jgi:hypothetical protein
MRLASEGSADVLICMDESVDAQPSENLCQVPSNPDDFTLYGGLLIACLADLSLSEVFSLVLPTANLLNASVRMLMVGQEIW